jgi:hypothetical protein
MKKNLTCKLMVMVLLALTSYQTQAQEILKCTALSGTTMKAYTLEAKNKVEESEKVVLEGRYEFYATSNMGTTTVGIYDRETEFRNEAEAFESVDVAVKLVLPKEGGATKLIYNHCMIK